MAFRLGALAFGSAVALTAACGARAQSPSYCGPAIFSGAAPAPFGPSLRSISCRVLPLVTPKGSVQLAVAATEADGERGLMFVRSMPPNVGMLFVFPGESAASSSG